MSTSKRFLIVGLVLFFVPIFLLNITEGLHDCQLYGDLSAALLRFLNFSLFPFMQTFGVLLQPIIYVGFLLCITAFVLLQRSKGVSWSVSIGGAIVIFLIVFQLGNILDPSYDRLEIVEIRSYIDSFRSKADVYNDTNGSYHGFCSTEILEANAYVQKVYDRGIGICKIDDISLDCLDSNESFAVSFELPPQNKSTYFCVDSTGFSDVTEVQISGPTCEVFQ